MLAEDSQEAAMRSTIPGLLIAGLVVAAVPATGVGARATSSPTDGSLRIVSRDENGHVLSIAHSQDISDDGRSVLLYGSTGEGGGLLLKDLDNRALTRVDLRDNGSEMRGPGGTDAQLSGNASRVVFTTHDTRMTSRRDTNGEQDVFVRRLGVSRTHLVSIAVSGAAGNDKSMYPAISASGRYVTFRSRADDLVDNDDNRRGDIFIRDLRLHRTRLVSVSDDEQPANGGSWESAVSRDGRYVAFTSLATNLVAGDTNDVSDVFVRDLVEGTTRRVNLSSDGAQATHRGEHVAISGDGRYVAFASRASTLSPNDRWLDFDIFMHDLVLGTTRWISVLGGGREASTALAPDVSEHGRFVAFNSTHHRSDPSTGCGGEHAIYLWDRTIQTARCLSPTYDGVPADGDSLGASIDAHGNAVVFTSDVANLVQHDPNGAEWDAFLWRRSVPD
jgi:Tol biopolymer transport system component